METQGLVLTSLWAFVIAAASLAGGYLPNLLRVTHKRMQLTMAFVSGLILGVAVFHLLPHAIASIPGEESVELAANWMMAGLVASLVLLYFFEHHEHDFSDEHAHAHELRDESGQRLHRLGLFGIIFGLGVHALTEGVALSSAIRIELQQSGPGAAGLGAFIAILLHKPLDSFSIASTMRANGYGAGARQLVNLGFALLCPLAALATWWVSGALGDAEALVLGCALAFSSGVLLCIALCDLIPEIHFHSHDRLALATVFLVGIAIAWSLHLVEPEALHG